MLLRILVYGVIAHLVIGWAFFFFAPPIDKKSPPVPVALRIVEKPSVSPKPPPMDVKSRWSQKSPPDPVPIDKKPSAQNQPPGAVVPTSTYTDLIPKATTGQIALPEGTVSGGKGLIEGHQFKPGTSGVTKQKLVIDASALSAALDVPLKARRDSAGMQAFLRIERLGTDALRIIDLRGDPMLRAVIFENLQEKKVQTILLNLMDALETSSLPITLQAIPGAAGRMQEELDFSWTLRRLIIRKSAPPLSKAPFGAISLPDEDAKKAIIQDRLEFERFQRSPAYRSTIQNYDVPTPDLR